MSYLRIGLAAERIGVTAKTIRRWDNNGMIKCTRTIGGHRRIAITEIERITINPEKKKKDYKRGKRKIAIYCRVSSHDQKKKGDLERQVKVVKKWLNERGEKEIIVFQEVGSGLNTKRRKLATLCKMIERKEIDKVVITYSDRITRFGYEFLQNYFLSHGTEIKVLNHKEEQSIEEEMVQDMIAIITSFSGKIYGLRSHKNKKRKRITLVETC